MSCRSSSINNFAYLHYLTHVECLALTVARVAVLRDGGGHQCAGAAAAPQVRVEAALAALENHPAAEQGAQPEHILLGEPRGHCEGR